MGIANAYAWYAYRQFCALLDSIRSSMVQLDVRRSPRAANAASHPQEDSSTTFAEAVSCLVMINDEDEDFVADPDSFAVGDVWVFFAWLAVLSVMVWYSWLP